MAHARTSQYADARRDCTSGHGASLPVCPRCRGLTYRIPRRALDRLISWFVPVRRYRCRSMNCHWEGNLRSLLPREGRGGGAESQSSYF